VSFHYLVSCIFMGEDGMASSIRWRYCYWNKLPNFKGGDGCKGNKWNLTVLNSRAKQT
jgi:hypothetical protein